jgi:hypothetical protein
LADEDTRAHVRERIHPGPLRVHHPVISHVGNDWARVFLITARMRKQTAWTSI